MAENSEAIEARSAPAEIYFRRAYHARNLYLPPDQDVRFSRIGELEASVDFANISWKEHGGDRGPSVRCTAMARCSVPKRCFEVYHALWHGRVPEELAASDVDLRPKHSSLGTDPVVLESRVPSFLSDAMKRIDAGLEAAVVRVVGLARWRCNQTGPVDMPELGFLQWSLDGGSWKLDVRRPIYPLVSMGPDLVLTEGRRRDIEQFLAASVDEPLHQSLLREADSLRERNPRSALAIGATAAEVAVKALVAIRAPQAAWLVQNLPSPPIAKILEEYVPIMLGGELKPIAPQLLKGLKAAVSLRNEFVHGARATIEPDRLSAAFLALRDVVWLCDFLSGVGWAVNRVSHDTRVAMGLTSTVDTSHWFVD
jgi:hypothetical protein